MINGKRFGVSLSGGGFRAAVYHLGTLKKLREMGVLDNVDVISTVSGGSITGACYGLYGHDWGKFEAVIQNGVKKDIINKIIFSPRFLIIAGCLLLVLGISFALLLTKHDWLTLIILFLTVFIILRYQFKILPVSKMIAKEYDKLFFDKKSIKDLNTFPWIAINATNLETGRLFTFSQLKMEDSHYEFPPDRGSPILFEHKNFPLTQAVSASAGVPFAFTPVVIPIKYYKNKSDVKRAKPVLVDGGVYDNQGIHKITQLKSAYNCDIIVTSDAENLFKETNLYRNLFHVLMRTSAVFMNRIKDFQMIQHVFENYRYDKREVAYQVMGWDLHYCMRMFMNAVKTGEVMDPVLEAHNITDDDFATKTWEEIQHKIEVNVGFANLLKEGPTEEELAIAREVKINIKALKQEQIDALIKQASSLTELQVRLYCPSLL
ncbi:MAG: patatin-like phospholipase family protein [Bacteroidia bacterium]|nr:patatin-like phospholipase family protein [Bacteroidia bacterium]